MPTSSSRRTPQLRRSPQHMPGCSLLRRFLRVLPYPSTSFHISAPLPQLLLHNLVRTRRPTALSRAAAFFPPQLLTTPPRLPPDGRAAAPRYHPSQPPAPRRPGPSFPSFPSRPALRFARPHIPDALPPLPAFPAPTFRKAQCLQAPPGERRNSASPRLPPFPANALSGTPGDRAGKRTPPSSIPPDRPEKFLPQSSAPDSGTLFPELFIVFFSQ